MTLAGPSRKPSVESEMPKLPLMRSASMANTVWSKKVTKVAKTIAASANQPALSGGHG